MIFFVFVSKKQFQLFFYSKHFKKYSLLLITLIATKYESDLTCVLYWLVYTQQYHKQTISLLKLCENNRKRHCYLFEASAVLGWNISKMPANNLQWMKATMFGKNFEWSLKPILMWMKWINGIDLVTTTKTRRISVMGLIMVIINFTVNAIACYAIIGSLLSIKNIPSLEIFCVGLDRANFLLYTLGTHATFYIISQTKWKSLWALIIDIEKNSKFTQKFYTDLRRIVLFGSVLFFLVYPQYKIIN